jgi:LysM repeat protein
MNMTISFPSDVAFTPTVKAIQALNNLKFTQIKTGQKLKLPAAKATVAKADLVMPTAANSKPVP